MVQTPLKSATGMRWFHYVLPVALTALVIVGMVLLRAMALPNTAPATASTVVSSSYTAGVRDHHLVIYAEGQTDPALETDIDIRTLPIADQTALQNGIFLESDEALSQLLEDYSS